MPFATVDEAAELYRRGELVIIVDDEDRENEGDLCIAAEKVTPQSINFMARLPDLREFAVQHGLKIISVADLINYRMQHEKHVHCLAAPRMPTPHGEFRVHAYKSDITGEEHVAVVMGEIREDDEILVRVH